MRDLLASRDMGEFRRKVRDHWGIGAFRYRNMGGPVLKASLAALKERPAVVAEWAEMFRRYYRNWEEGRFDPLSVS
ncbi:MAG: hypothetical protein H5T74_09670 [Actinobacteria bacterium]|nr:hypothetical protein [Actinomycetota bacterium]